MKTISDLEPIELLDLYTKILRETNYVLDTEVQEFITDYGYEDMYRAKEALYHQILYKMRYNPL